MFNKKNKYQDIMDKIPNYDESIEATLSFIINNFECNKICFEENYVKYYGTEYVDNSIKIRYIFQEYTGEYEAKPDLNQKYVGYYVWDKNNSLVYPVCNKYDKNADWINYIDLLMFYHIYTKDNIDNKKTDRSK